jgi:hypothetical protein
VSLATQKYIGFDQLIDHLTREIIRADTSMQLRQQRAWDDLRSRAGVGEILPENGKLGISRISFEFCLAPPRWWVRLWRRFPAMFGHLVKNRYRLVGVSAADKKGGYKVEVAIRRTDEGAWRVESNPVLDEVRREQVLVPNPFR